MTERVTRGRDAMTYTLLGFFLGVALTLLYLAVWWSEYPC
jgi:hypothetical protein